MRNRPARLYLQDIIDSAEAIQSYVQDISFEAFSRDRMRSAAVTREFEIIGEAVGKLPAEITSRVSGYSLARNQGFSKSSNP
jgi:uncharacterized protein with HEPN domain